MVAAGLAATSVIGVDVGGTKILAGVVGRDGSLARVRERSTPTGSQKELLAGLAEAVATVLAEAGDSAAAIGIGVPSRVDLRNGTAVASTNVPLTGVPLREHWEERFSRPVAVDNDATLAAIAEWQVGAGRGTRHLVMLTLGTGIGGGLILDGRPYRGAVGGGAELGHTVVEHDGTPCQGTCTGRGHLEALASGGAADRIARELFGPTATAPELVAAARDGDEAAAQALRELGRRLGSGIASLVNTFEPEIVVLGGGFATGAFGLLLPPVLEVLARDGLQPGASRVRIEPAKLGVHAGVVGAGLVAFELLDAAPGGAGV